MLRQMRTRWRVSRAYRTWKRSKGKDAPSPGDYYWKHGSSHARALLKLAERLSETRRRLTNIEGGWGDYGDEVFELERRLRDLAARIGGAKAFPRE